MTIPTLQPPPDRDSFRPTENMNVLIAIAPTRAEMRTSTQPEQQGQLYQAVHAVIHVLDGPDAGKEYPDAMFGGIFGEQMALHIESPPQWVYGRVARHPRSPRSVQLVPHRPVDEPLILAHQQRAPRPADAAQVIQNHIASGPPPVGAPYQQPVPPAAPPAPEPQPAMQAAAPQWAPQPLPGDDPPPF